MPSRHRSHVKKLVGVTTVIAAAALWATVSQATTKEEIVSSQQVSSVASSITAAELATVARAKVFFGHQSVGANILDGVPGVYAARGVAAPTIAQGGPPSRDGGGFIEHAFIGENGQPLLKLQDFNAKLRSGIGTSVDVAMMKFCYIDINSNTNVDELFAAYRQTMNGLQRDFPNVTFLYTTVPLTTDQGLLSKLKAWVTGNSTSYEADNVTRERLNELIRHEYAGPRLFDLAAVESTTPDGSRAGGTYEGQQYYRLYGGYASDSGHLNSGDAEIAATAWLKTVAKAAAR